MSCSFFMFGTGDLAYMLTNLSSEGFSLPFGLRRCTSLYFPQVFLAGNTLALPAQLRTRKAPFLGLSAARRPTFLPWLEGYRRLRKSSMGVRIVEQRHRVLRAIALHALIRHDINGKAFFWHCVSPIICLREALSEVAQVLRHFYGSQQKALELVGGAVP